MERSLHRLFAPLPLLALLVSSPVVADSYADLPDNDKAYVKRICAPIQYQIDTAAYRSCVAQQSEAIQKTNRTPVASLGFDEQLSVQQTCQKDGDIGSTEYRLCVVVQARSLEGILAEDMSSLNAEQIYTARLSCANTDNGVKAYRLCVNDAVTDLKAPGTGTAIAALPTNDSEAQISQTAFEDTLEPVELAELTELTELTEEAEPSEEILLTEPANASWALEDEPTILADSASSVTTTSSGLQHSTALSTATLPIHTAIRVNTAVTRQPMGEEPATVQSDIAELQFRQITAQNEVTVGLPAASPKPELSAAEPKNSDTENTATDSQEPADNNDLDPANTNKPPLELAKDYAQKLWDQLQASLEGVQGMDRIILLAALALPFLLIGFWLIMRRSTKESESYAQPHSSSLPNQVHANPSHSMNDDSAYSSNDTMSTQRSHFADQVEDMFADEDADPVFLDDDEPDFTDDESVTDLDLGPAVKETAQTKPTSELSALLANHDKQDQLGLVVEFMIYWMAFTDERYEPELKQKVFAEQEPDDHDLIKRCVLNQDFAAFAVATSWLQKNATAAEREQVLKLLMALLVYEEGITPVQNTMLRFLSNAFGLTHIQLDALFQTAFGHELPAMPRPDKPAWWNKQPADKLKRWDARSVAKQSPAIQARVQLGLALSGDLDPLQISERHERAILRCQADNFDLLTSREQQLAERQQAKYHNALEVLMEISE